MRNGLLLQVTAVAILLAVTVACEEDNPSLVLETGTTRLYPSAPGTTGFRWQEIKQPELYVQAAKWDFISAEFHYPGLSIDVLDLADTPSSPSCDLQASIAFRDPTASLSNGACRLGKVIDTITQAVPATLDVTFRLTLYRADPAELIQRASNASEVDYDGDLLLNEDDPCPLIPAAELGGPQDLSDCSLPDIGGRFLSDQDADGVSDTSDNCVWVFNPSQANTIDEDLSINDAIGNACTRQEAVTPEVTISFDPTDLVQPERTPSFVVLDFDFATVGAACDWDAGTCNNLVLDESSVGYCITTDPTTAAFEGCP